MAATKYDRSIKESEEIGNELSKLNFLQRDYAAQFFLGYMASGKNWPAVKAAFEKAIDHAKRAGNDPNGRGIR